MGKPIEFGKFYKLIEEIKKGKEDAKTNFNQLMNDYMTGEKAESDFEELGQHFCNIGIKEIYSYTGLEDIKTISKLEKNIWEYLRLRNNISLKNYIIKKMIDASKNDGKINIIKEKWRSGESILEKNLEGLAEYVTEGIIELIET